MSFFFTPPLFLTSNARIRPDFYPIIVTSVFRKQWQPYHKRTVGRFREFVHHKSLILSSLYLRALFHISFPVSVGPETSIPYESVCFSMFFLEYGNLKKLIVMPLH